MLLIRVGSRYVRTSEMRIDSCKSAVNVNSLHRQESYRKAFNRIRSEIRSRNGRQHT